MRTVLVRIGAVGLAMAVASGLMACGETDGDGSDAEAAGHVVVTTSILGDVVSNLVGDTLEVTVIMPPNADPHDFAPSAQQANEIREADALVVNGLGFEEGLLDTVEAAEADGVPIITATDAIDPIRFAAADEEHAKDPHFFTDPARMRDAAGLIADELVVHIPALDTPEFVERTDAYLSELEALDADVEDLLVPVPHEQRVLITNHEVFGYFADRYDFEVLGVIIPGGTTLSEPSAAELAELAREIEEHGMPAIFADTSSPSRLADALAAEGTDVEVVELYSESLGEEGSPGETYIGMVSTNAQRIAAALT